MLPPLLVIGQAMHVVVVVFQQIVEMLLNNVVEKEVHEERGG